MKLTLFWGLRKGLVLLQTVVRRQWFVGWHWAWLEKPQKNLPRVRNSLRHGFSTIDKEGGATGNIVWEDSAQSLCVWPGTSCGLKFCRGLTASWKRIVKVFVFLVVLVLFFGCWLLFGLPVLCFWVVVLPLCPCLHPRLDFLDCVMVHALFKLPNAGCCCTLHNSFNGTNTVLRPGESREGEGRKRKNGKRIVKISLNSIIVPRVPWGLKILEIACAEVAERTLSPWGSKEAQRAQNASNSLRRGSGRKFEVSSNYMSKM